MAKKKVEMQAEKTTSEKPAKVKPGYKFPKMIGACADKVYELREKRKAMQKLVDEVEEEEKALKEHIINILPKSEASGASGKLANVKVVTKEVPQVKDWDAFYKYIKKTGEFDLMGRTISRTSIEERLDAGKKVPGIEMFQAVTLSITKV
jgi:hypothetical protein